MKSTARYLAAVFCLLLPGITKAQHSGQIECARTESYVYLYSSLTTLDIRSTLQCGEQVQITVRYENYYGVRTQKGEAGFVPLNSLVVLKDKPGAKALPAKPQAPARPRMAYDDPAAQTEAPAKAPATGSGFTLLNGTPIHLKLGRTISSATAHLDEPVELEVAEDVMVDGVCVIPKGAKATGVVAEAEPKKRMGHGGKLGLSITSVVLRDSEKAAVRSYQEGSGSNSSTGTINPLAHGKDVVFTQGTEFTAYVDGDVRLKREAFQSTKTADK